jgi:hypothetical protein
MSPAGSRTCSSSFPGDPPRPDGSVTRWRRIHEGSPVRSETQTLATSGHREASRSAFTLLTFQPTRRTLRRPPRDLAQGVFDAAPESNRTGRWRRSTRQRRRARELLDVPREAIATRNGWKHILARCANSQRAG